MLNYTETEIVHASPERIWHYLGDVTHWPDYFDTVTSVEPLDASQLALGGGGSACSSPASDRRCGR